MSHESTGEPFHQSHLESPEYRERLMRKLNCLIAVLEVATAKVKKSLNTPSGDTERLVRIKGNLQSTLDVCLRARSALERREALPKELPENLTQVIADSAALGAGEGPLERIEPTQPSPRRLRGREFSKAERARFAKLGAIDRKAVRLVNLDLLSRELQG